MIPDGKDRKAVRADAAAVIEHLRAGGKWTSFGVLTPKAVKDRTYLREAVTVDGQSAETPDGCGWFAIISISPLRLRTWSLHGPITADCRPGRNRGYGWPRSGSTSIALAGL